MIIKKEDSNFKPIVKQKSSKFEAFLPKILKQIKDNINEIAARNQN